MLEAYLLVIYIAVSAETRGPYDILGVENCMTSGMIVADMIPNGWVRCIHKDSGEVIVEWKR